MPSSDPQFIVVSKNWDWPAHDAAAAAGGLASAQSHYISGMFEEMIAVNLLRGYRLHSFQLSRMMTAEDVLNETIVAVFEKKGATP